MCSLLHAYALCSVFGGCCSVWHKQSGGRRKSNLSGFDRFMKENGVEVIDLNLDECYDLLGEFTVKHPDIWKEDTGKS